MKLSPIALFVYKRPLHTERAVEFLKKNKEAQDSDLFIFSDGPRSDDQNQDVHAVRQYIKTITGFKSINIIENNKNLGLAASIIDGVSALCKTHGRALVLEDDLLVSPHFLQYMNTAIQRYESNDAVMQISGHMFPVDLSIKEDTFFLPFTTSWGWATWKRAWQHFDPNIVQYDRLAAEPSEKRRFDLDGAYPYFKMLRSQKKKEIDSWAVRWYLSVFNRQGLTLFPRKTLVQNIGFDRSGTHTMIREDGLSASISDFRVLSYPKEAAVSRIAFEETKRYLMRRNGIWHKIVNSLYSLK